MSISSIGSSNGWALRSVVAAMVLLLVPQESEAQDPNLVDQGRYDISVGGVTGTETFAIRRQGEGYMAVGRLQIEGGPAWLVSAEFGLRTDGAFTPVRFETRSLDRPAGRLIVTRSGTRLRITKSTDEGERMTELLATPNQVLLAPGIAQHYYFVVRRLLAAGERADLLAILPEGGEERAVRLVSSTDSEIGQGPTSVRARRYEFDVGGVTHVVWADPSDGRVYRVDVPSLDWSSIRRSDN